MRVHWNVILDIVTELFGVRPVLYRHLPTHRDDVFDAPRKLNFFLSRFPSLTVFCSHEQINELRGFEHLWPRDRSQEAIQLLRSLGQIFLIRLDILYLGQWRHKHVRELLDQQLPQRIKVRVLAFNRVLFGLPIDFGLNVKHHVVRRKDSRFNHLGLEYLHRHLLIV